MGNILILKSFLFNIYEKNSNKTLNRTFFHFLRTKKRVYISKEKL